MPIRVKVEGHGIVEFPDGTSQDEMAAALATLPAATGQAPAVNMMGDVYGTPADIGKGVLKGAAKTAMALGEWVHQIPGVSTAVDALYGRPGLSQAAFADPQIQQLTTPTNTPQQIGQSAEQIGEYLIPAGTAERVAATVTSHLPQVTSRVAQAVARTAPRMAADAALGASVASVQGTDPRSAAVFGAGGVVAGRTTGAIAEWASQKAAPLVRSAIKPTVTAMKRIAGASQTGIDVKADQLVRFIIEHRITSPEKARNILQEAEYELQRVLPVKNAPTDAPTRALRYLQALEKSASRQGLPASDVATLRNAMGELVQTGLGEDVVKMVQQPHPTLVGPNGKPLMVSVPVTTRQLRPNVPAKEALERARATSRWETRKQYGEQKGASVEASKAVERGLRDAVKTAVPEAAPLLKRESQAIQAADVLDRMAFRAANRDALSLPGVVAAAPEIAAGRLPVLGFAAQWLRNNQLKAGMWADDLRMALARKDVQRTTDILRRLGVAIPSAQSQR